MDKLDRIARAFGFLKVMEEDHKNYFRLIARIDPTILEDAVLDRIYTNPRVPLDEIQVILHGVDDGEDFAAMLLGRGLFEGKKSWFLIPIRLSEIKSTDTELVAS